MTLASAAASPLGEHAHTILQAALEAADPYAAVRRHVTLERNQLRIGAQTYPLARYRRVVALGAGKASAPMAQALEDILRGQLDVGLVCVKDGHTVPLQRVQLHEAAHPVPDERGVEGARMAAGIARQLTAEDLLLVAISGGASALWPLPAPGITLAEKQETTRLLLACGATIHEINSVRKHLSAIKGGHLARLASPATVVSLLLSDVIGDDLDVIGSGPTAPDLSTYADAIGILQRFGIGERVPEPVRTLLEAGARGEHVETPKPGEPVFAHVQNVVVGSNALAVMAAAEAATQLGYRALVLSTSIQGETRDVAQMHAAIAREVVQHGHPVPAPACLLSGGETTVTLRGNGRGGRNQEFVLAAALEMAGLPRVLVTSLGTDGSDGPTDAAGAYADGTTVARAAAQGMSARGYLDRNDSYSFFDALGELMRTGPTRTNVMDVRVMLVG